MRSASVFAVTTPSAYPKCAPAIGDVEFPPAALSADAVMIPGPRTARNSRIFFLLNRRKRTFHPFSQAPSPVGKYHTFRVRRPRKRRIPRRFPDKIERRNHPRGETVGRTHPLHLRRPRRPEGPALQPPEGLLPGDHRGHRRRLPPCLGFTGSPCR